MGCTPERPIIGQATSTPSGVNPHAHLSPQKIHAPRLRCEASGAHAAASTAPPTPCPCWGQNCGARLRWGPLICRCRSRLTPRERGPARSHACVGGRPGRCACCASSPLYARRPTHTTDLAHGRGLCRGERCPHLAPRSPRHTPPRSVARHGCPLGLTADAITLCTQCLTPGDVSPGARIGGAVYGVLYQAPRGHRARCR